MSNSYKRKDRTRLDYKLSRKREADDLERIAKAQKRNAERLEHQRRKLRIWRDVKSRIAAEKAKREESE